MAERVGGIIQLATNGTRLSCVGSFEWNLGEPVKTAVVGHDRTHGYKELPQTPFLAGEIRVTSDLDVRAILATSDATITLVLPTSAVFVLRNAWYAGEGTVATEEGNMECRFEGLSADLSRAP